MSSNRSQRFQVTLDSEVSAHVRALAEKENKSAAALIRELATKQLLSQSGAA